MSGSDNAEHLEEDHNANHKDDSDDDTGTIHLFSCIYCATDLHGQCRGTEKYKDGLIRCECFDAGHPESTAGLQ